MTNEVLYSFRINRHDSLCLTKWVDGERYPDETYTITHRGRGHCDCIGSMRTPYCKHKRLVQEVLPKFGGTRFMGCFLNLETETLYHPEDGEGIPLTGAIDILWEAQQQGKGY